jgi:glycosyltransferase 2 family protein
MNVITRTVDKKISWSRIGYATSLLIIAIAAVTLFRLLRDVDVEKVVAALASTSSRKVLIAGIFVTTGYATLTLYDFFSLRTIGRHEVPYRIAALASFTSYSIVTLSVRLYSRAGRSGCGFIQLGD